MVMVYSKGSQAERTDDKVVAEDKEFGGWYRVTDGKDWEYLAADRGVAIDVKNAFGIEYTQLAETKTRIEQAADECNVDGVGDDGASILMRTSGKNTTGNASYVGVACVLVKLGAGDYVIDHIDSTRSLDGQQTEEWDGLQARWTYHPDNGLNLSIVDRNLVK